MSAQTYTVTAFYDTRDGAEAGAELLKREGIPATDIDIIHGEPAEAGTGAQEDKGFVDKLSNTFMPDEDRDTYATGIAKGGYVLKVDASEADHERVVALLDTDNSVDMDERSGAWRAEGWDGGYESTGSAGPAEGASTDIGEGQKIEVVEEQLKVGKRDVARGSVRVRSYTVSEEVSADVTLESQSAEIERRRVDRVLTGDEVDEVFQDKEILVEERAEEAVVSKEAHIVEEIDVSKEVDRRTETVTDTVRRTEVDIDRDKS